METRAVLCDLGNVAVFFDNDKVMRAFSAVSSVSEDAVRKAIFGRGSPLLSRYERGEIDTPQFRRIVCARLNVVKRDKPSDEAFFDVWTDVFTPNEPLLERLRLLAKEGAVIAAVSNIDEMRHRKLERMRLMDVFDHQVMSYLEGLEKPSEELMVRALDRCGVVAEKAVFIDDIAENLVPAAKIGIRTHLYRDIEELDVFLESCGA